MKIVPPLEQLRDQLETDLTPPDRVRHAGDDADLAADPKLETTANLLSRLQADDNELTIWLNDRVDRLVQYEDLAVDDEALRDLLWSKFVRLSDTSGGITAHPGLAFCLRLLPVSHSWMHFFVSRRKFSCRFQEPIYMHIIFLPFPFPFPAVSICIYIYIYIYPNLCQPAVIHL